MDKFISVEQAVSMVKDGMTLMIGGFLGVGSANKVLKGIHDAGIKNLTIIGNDTAFVDKGVGILVANHQVKKAIVSHIGTNPALQLRRPIYRQLAAYGHIGREDLDVVWERTDKVDALRNAANI